MSSSGWGSALPLEFFLAPKSGQETREQIAGAVKEGLDEAIATGQDIAQRAQDTVDDARERVKEATEAGQEAYRKAKSTVA